MRITKKLVYAIEAVLDIAYNSTEDTVQASDIARRQKIPKRYLEQVLQQLVKTQILSGVRGPQGGYRLAKERRRIHLGEIYDTIRQMETTEDPIHHESSELGEKVLLPLWQTLFDDMYRKLEQTTIEDLCLNAKQAGVKTQSRRPPDYVI